MGSKLNPGRFDCYDAALPDEPMFILLARDPSAPGLVNKWASERQHAIRVGQRSLKDREMVHEALRCAEDMHRWRAHNNGVWRRPLADNHQPDMRYVTHVEIKHSAKLDEAIKRFQNTTTSPLSRPITPPTLYPDDYQLLWQLEQANHSQGVRPVISSRREGEWRQAARLSRGGYIAIEQLAMGGRLHITAKGFDALHNFEKEGTLPKSEKAEPAVTAAERDELVSALRSLYELCTLHAIPGAFNNGVTDSTGTIDEGDGHASGLLDNALSVLRRHNACDRELAPLRYTIEHDGFTGTKIGYYVTLEGKHGAVLQQDGSRVVHVYGEKWLKPAVDRK